MKTKPHSAFTLIEMVVVLGAIAALAAAVLLPLLAHLDDLAARKEADTLQRMARSFKERVLRTKVIPSESDWAATLASDMGLQLNAVANNDRGLRRVFLIDSELKVGNNIAFTLPYTQTISGHTIATVTGAVRPPISPRLMLISSISTPLPVGLVSGVAPGSGVNTFNNIWSTADNAIPAGWVWPGRGENLKIQRIDLSELFVQVILNNRDNPLAGTPDPTYRMDNLGPASVPFRGLTTMYFLKGSEIKLYNAAGLLEYSEVLYNSQSFTFELGTWQSEAFLANSVSQISPLDLQRVMNMFMAAPTNSYAGKWSVNQTVVSNAVVQFLKEFIAWRDATPTSYPGQDKNNPPTTLETAQKKVETVTSQLLTAQGN